MNTRLVEINRIHFATQIVAVQTKNIIMNLCSVETIMSNRYLMSAVGMVN